ncbi:LOW QUALITY PROTEIN: GTP-binding protein Rhes-like [Daphnia carinata]|uniref:LOW QUALITY PROTEIN: GTP-binding protein Rhes-like n=1 Tax=Daphnia carinata TaxID=120202 RepID=UPI00257F6284|nr:LOW QUALITY PROTEIN: GTP-binding protein Rhes-like [Daphnia carinata]
MKGGHSQRRRFSLQALCVVQSPTSEEEPLGNTSSHCHQTVDEMSLEESAGRCGTPSSSHRQSRRRRPLSTEPAISSASKSSAGKNLVPPAPSTPVKSHYKVVVMGSARAGKTSLVGQFLYAAYSPRYRPTVEDMHTVELDCQGLDLRLDILDTGGSYVFPAMRSLAIKSADGFILVCASDDPSSLEEAEHCRSQILEVKGPACPVVVVLNKTDLIRSGSVSSEPPTDEEKNENQAIGGGGSRAGSDGGNFLCQEMVESLVTCDWGHGFVPASAKNNINVVQVFQELFIQAKSRIALSPAVRKRRQSLPARTLIPPGTSGSHPHPQLGHHLSLHGSNVAAAAAAAAATAAANASVSSSPTGTSSFAKRNSCTVS